MPCASRTRARQRRTSPSACSWAPSSRAPDRRAWIELDKLSYRAPLGKSVVYRSDTEFSVVKKPAEADPANVQPGGGDPDDPAYCDCGWPYTLLLPRGTSTGMAFRLAVICTDAAIDNVAAAGVRVDELLRCRRALPRHA